MAAYAGLIAFSAYGGAIGLAGGGADPNGTLDARLPFASPVFAAVALTVIVGVPNTVVAALALRHDARTGPAELVAGVLLVGWIVVELAVIREWSWLQPLYAAIGVSLIAGSRARAGDAHRVTPLR